MKLSVMGFRPPDLWLWSGCCAPAFPAANADSDSESESSVEFVIDGWKHRMASAYREYSVVQLPFQSYDNFALDPSAATPRSSQCAR